MRTGRETAQTLEEVVLFDPAASEVRSVYSRDTGSGHNMCDQTGKENLQVGNIPLQHFTLRNRAKRKTTR